MYVRTVPYDEGAAETRTKSPITELRYQILIILLRNEKCKKILQFMFRIVKQKKVRFTMYFAK